MGVRDATVLAVLVSCYLALIFRHANGDKVKFKPVRKHTIKTVKDSFGDIFDCVDIYKQPAFYHPLLKNHILQMKPSILPKGAAVDSTSERESVSSQVSRLIEKCPDGSVPILRMPKTLARTLKPPTNFTANDILNSHYPDSTTVNASYFAEARMYTGEYYGSKAELNAWSVPQTTPNQLSGSAIWIIHDGGGQRDQINSILAGWIVHPSLFGDAQTRFFIYWTADGFQKIGCYNVECQGFVVVNPIIPLGGVVSPVSEYNGAQYVLKILIFQDPKTGNWWLAMGEKLDQMVGYWPKSLFTSLAGPASSIRWGGMAYTSNGEKSPPMGSGHHAAEGYKKASFFDRTKIVVGGNQFKDIGEGDVEYYQTTPCYTVGHFQRMQYGSFFPFGGPGGC